MRQLFERWRYFKILKINVKTDVLLSFQNPSDGSLLFGRKTTLLLSTVKCVQFFVKVKLKHQTLKVHTQMSVDTILKRTDVKSLKLVSY